MRLVSWVLLTTFVIGISAPARAQSATGDIRGVVFDPAGTLLGGVAVTVTDVATSAERQTMTDEAGRFAVMAVPAGSYEVTARLSGYAARRQEALRVPAGATVPLRMELTRAALPDTMNVSGVPAVIDGARSSQSSVISNAEIEQLPLNGRNVLDLVTLVPGVTRHVSTREFSVLGQREWLTSLLVDGIDRSDVASGRSLNQVDPLNGAVLLPVEAVQEIRVDVSAYSAEYGRSGAGSVGVVTRSGSNRLTGSAFDFFRDDALTWNTPLNEDRGLAERPFQLNQFGGVIGGPIGSGRHFFFGAYQGQRGTSGNPAAALRLVTSLNGGAEQTTIFGGGEFAHDSDSFLARTDHRFGGAYALSLRYDDQRRPTPISGVLGDQLSGAFLASEHRPAGGATFSSSLGKSVNEVRLAYSREPESDIVRRLMSARDTSIDTWQLADTVNWSAGAHLVKTGVDLQFNRASARGPFDSTFRDTLAALGLAVPEGDGDRGRAIGAFVQDAWQATPALTINAGLRYDWQRSPVIRSALVDVLLRAGASDDRLESSDWGPRLGLAWRPVGARYVLRGGYGISYGRTPWAGVPSLVDPDVSSSRVQQASAGAEWEWMPYTSIGITAMHASGDRLPGGALVADFTSQGTAESRYDGVAIELHRRFAQSSYYRVSYTFSKATDSIRVTAPSDSDQRHHLAGSIVYLTNQYASAREGLIRALLRDWTLSAVFRVASGQPYSAYVVGGFNGGNLVDNAPGTNRNQYNLPTQVTLDGRLARDIHTGGRTKVSLILEMFNVRNRPNYTAVDELLYTVNPARPSTLVPNPRFGEAIAQANPRTAQLAVKFAF